MTEAISEFLVKYGMEIAASYRTREDLSGRTLDLQPQLLLPTFYLLLSTSIQNSQLTIPSHQITSAPFALSAVTTFHPQSTDLTSQLILHNSYFLLSNYQLLTPNSQLLTPNS